MMKKTAILILAALIPSVCEAGFQATEWLDSPQEVIRKQKIPKAERSWSEGTLSILAHSTRFTGEEALVGYIFVEKKLVRVSVIFTETYIQKLKLLRRFDSMERKLTRVYGEPDSDDTVWSGDLYRDDPDQYGMAVVTGDLMFRTLRTKSGLNILHILDGGNFKANHRLAYYTDETFEIEKSAAEAAQDSEL